MKVGLSACSSGHLPEWEDQITELADVLAGMGIKAEPAAHIIRTVDEFSGTDEERAADLMKFYTDDEIGAIYDIAGSITNLDVR